MRRWTFVKEKSKLMSNINVTPLVDVALVLLIIFMVTTPLMMQESFKVKLPEATTAEPQVEQTTTISVAPGNVVYLNEAEVNIDDLAGLLASRMATSADKTVVVKADKSVMHGFVVKVLDAAKEAGALKLAIATEHGTK